MSSILIIRHFRNLLKHPSALQNKCLMKFDTNVSPVTPTYATKFIKRNNTTSDEWRIIYQLPLIRVASAFNRVKILYGLLNTLAIPSVFALEQYLELPQSSALIISSIGLTSWCTLAIFSFFIKNLIGIIYVNDNNDKLKLAYVDYWGKRRDVCIALGNLIPENEQLKPSQFDFYQSLCIYSDDKVNYKLLKRFGRIEDPETFASIFGE